MKTIKKKDIVETNYVIDKDAYDDVKQELKTDLKDGDAVKIVDDEEDINEETIQENIRPIITKKDLMKLIKENRNG